LCESSEEKRKKEVKSKEEIYINKYKDEEEKSMTM